MDYQAAYDHTTNEEKDAVRREDTKIISRKVARSGHVSYDGHPYFVSKNLAGSHVQLIIIQNRLIIDTSIPLHKEYQL